MRHYGPKMAVLVDLELWIKRHLELLKARQNNKYDLKPEGYAVAEIPEWELRQKLEAIEKAIADEPSSNKLP